MDNVDVLSDRSIGLDVADDTGGKTLGFFGTSCKLFTIARSAVHKKHNYTFSCFWVFPLLLVL